MRVVIIGRDLELLEPFAEKLNQAGFEVVIFEHRAALLADLQNVSAQFVLAESNLLLRQGLYREILKRCPLARVIAWVAKPNRLDFISALAEGLTDYFPRNQEQCEELFALLLRERERVARWQHILLAPAS